MAKTLDKIIVATSDKKSDDEVAKTATRLGVAVFRGSENDVLKRYYQAARKYKADTVVRLMADCIFIDPKIIDETVRYYARHKKEIDYTSKPLNYPQGFDVEVFSFKVLERANREAQKKSEREHVSPYIKNHPELFICRHWKKGRTDNSELHLSVDEPCDFELAEKIFDSFADSGMFYMDDILSLLRKRPELKKINAGLSGYEGYARSLKEDQIEENKIEVYKKIVGFIPEAIIVLSAGTVRTSGPGGAVTYRSTKAHEGDTFGTLFGEARVIATAELASYYPETSIVTTSCRSKGEPSHARIIRSELVKLSIPFSRVILEEYSSNTFSQISESLKIAYKRKWNRIAFITSAYHVRRVRAMYEHFEQMSASKEAKNIVSKIKKIGVQVSFVSAEKILMKRDRSYVGIIRALKKTDAYQKRLKNEDEGRKAVLNANYTEQPTKLEDKQERGR